MDSSSNRKLRLGLVGLGKMGILHLNLLKFIDGVVLESAADKNQRNLEKAEKLGVKKLFSDYRDMYEKVELDAVIIALPHFMHEEAVILAAEKGFNIFVEKPLGRTVKECKNMLKAVERNNVKLCVDHNYRFFKNVEKLKRMYNNGYIGEVSLFTSANVTGGPFSIPLFSEDWWIKPELSGGGALIALGPHLIDLFEWFFGNTTVLSAALSSRFSVDFEDTASITVKSRNAGTIGTINVGWFERTAFSKFDFYVRLHGTGGCISTDDLGPKNLFVNAAKECIKNVIRRILGRKIHPMSIQYFPHSYYVILTKFLESIIEDTEPPVNGRDGLKTIEIIEDAYKIAGVNYLGDA